MVGRILTARVDRPRHPSLYSFIRDWRAAATKTASAELRQRIASNDLAFHTVILEVADNSQLTKLVTDFKVLIQIFIGFIPEKYDDRLNGLVNTYRYHRRIVQVLQITRA